MGVGGVGDSTLTYFTSDTHFFHKNVIQFCNRPWKTVDEMNAGLIGNWNETVKPKDDVYILGDMFFCGTIQAKEILKQLNGRKFLVSGNHDWGKLKKHRAVEFGFEWIVETFCVRLGRHDVKLSHFPYKNAGDHTEGEERYKEKRLQDHGGWLLHGHVHCLWKIKDKQINVGVDVWDYRPVSAETILSLIGENE